MKKNLLLGLVLIISTNLHAQITWKTEELKGRIRFIKTTTYEFVEKFGEVERGDHAGSTGIFFDLQGYATKKISFDDQNEGPRDTSGLTTYTYVFNEQNQLREINEYEGYKTLHYKTKFKYNTNGQLSEKNIYFGNGSLKQQYIYQEENGKLIEKELDEEGEVIIRSEMYNLDYIIYKIGEIDANGNWIKKIGFKNEKQVSEITRKIIYY